MARARPIDRLTQHERLNFLLTNRVPRRWATLLMGRLSRIENRLFVRAALAVWQWLGGDLALDEAEQRSFRSLHACFTRALKPGARPVNADPAVLVSPCDAVVGACGPVDGNEVFQAKGFPYTLEELFGDPTLAGHYRDGVFATLRLRSCMYHRFHAPGGATLREVVYISGDTWNVNPIALRRVERLYCRNERAVLDFDLGPGEPRLALVAVAAILVASIRIHALPDRLHLGYRGPKRIRCGAKVGRGEELGWFEHGSTILVFAGPGAALSPGVREGATIRMGVPLLQRDPGRHASHIDSSSDCHGRITDAA